MDDYNITSLQESNNEWVNRLISILTPCIIDGCKIVYQEALKLCVGALAKVVPDQFSGDRIDTMYIKSDERKFRKFSRERIEKVVKEIKKK